MDSKSKKLEITITSDGANGKTHLMLLIADFLRLQGYGVSTYDNGVDVPHGCCEGTNGRTVEIKVMQGKTEKPSPLTGTEAIVFALTGQDHDTIDETSTIRDVLLSICSSLEDINGTLGSICDIADRNTAN